MIPNKRAEPKLGKWNFGKSFHLPKKKIPIIGPNVKEEIFSPNSTKLSDRFLERKSGRRELKNNTIPQKKVILELKTFFFLSKYLNFQSTTKVKERELIELERVDIELAKIAAIKSPNIGLGICSEIKVEKTLSG